MTREFPPVELDDQQGEQIRVELGRDTDWQVCVRVTARSTCTFDKASNYLPPETARALARAILEAATEAEIQQDEEDAANGRYEDTGTDAPAENVPGF